MKKTNKKQGSTAKNIQKNSQNPVSNKQQNAQRDSSKNLNQKTTSQPILSKQINENEKIVKPIELKKSKSKVLKPVAPQLATTWDNFKKFAFFTVFIVVLIVIIWNIQQNSEAIRKAEILATVSDKAADLKIEMEKILNSTQERLKDWNSEIVSEMLASFDIKFFPTLRTKEERPGQTEKGLKKKYPVVLFPGFITSQLELWHSEECAESFFTHSIWGSLSMVEFIVRKPYCWIQHMSLDLKTGLDPENIKARAVQSTHGISYLFPGFWVFGKLIQNLADIGYDSSSMYSANYDWRLSPKLVEKRDGFYTKLKKNIEALKETHKEKVIVIAHSLGGAYYYYFMQWVNDIDPLWIHTNIHAFINAGGALLGVPKSFPALISGEMKDSADLELGRAYFADAVISPIDRLAMIRSWPSVGSLLPKGGEIVWGDHKGSPEDDLNITQTDSSNYLIRFTNGTGLTISESLNFLRGRLQRGEKDHSDVWKRIVENNNFDFKTPKTGFNSPLTERDWTSPLTSPLPYAPKMKIYCLYGVGKPTERGFYYHDWNETSTPAEFLDETLKNVHPLSGIQYSIATNKGSAGIHLNDGDGTVTLASLGYMCVDAWKNRFYNPSETTIITREYQHNPQSILESFSPRGGTTTADHVDILGNTEYLLDILKIVSGSLEKDEDRIISRVKEVSKKITERANKRNN